MNEFRWNQEKNLLLQVTRGISFEEIVAAIEAGKLLDEVSHPSRPNQRIYVVEIDDYPWEVPYVVETDGAHFLKTAYPSRKRK